MQQDPILEEIHQVREEYTARFNYDLRAMYRDLKAREERGESIVVQRSPRPPQVNGRLPVRSSDNVAPR